MASPTLKRPLEFDPLDSPTPAKRQLCTPMSISPANSPLRPSAFSWGTKTNTPSRVAKMTPDVIATGIFDEMKRLHRRKELHLPSQCTSASDPSAPPSNSSDGDDSDTPFFTFHQVETICSKMLSEQEGRLLCEYEAILSEMLKEQFAIFNRFSTDQIDRLTRHNNSRVSRSLTYLS